MHASRLPVYIYVCVCLYMRAFWLRVLVYVCMHEAYVHMHAGMCRGEKQVCVWLSRAFVIIHACIYANLTACTHTHLYIHAYIYACMQTNTQTRIRENTLICIWAMCMHIHVCRLELIYVLWKIQRRVYAHAVCMYIAYLLYADSGTLYT
jgi:hypothetical protein